jgi:TolB protein
MRVMKRWIKYLLIGVVVLVIVVAAILIFLYVRLRKDPVELSQTYRDLAFISDREGDWDIFMRDPDGNLADITGEGEGHDFFLNFPFSGKIVNFFTTRSGEVTPALVNVDGSGLETLGWGDLIDNVILEGNAHMDPTWGPGGEKLMWNSVRDLNSEIYMANADGSSRKRLTDNWGTDYMAAWSPDGTRIVFISDRKGKQNVYVLNVDTGEQTELTDNQNFDNQPVWSLDGEKILFISESKEVPLTTGVFELYVMNADGSDLHLLGEDEVFQGDPTYSPDGKQIAYMSNESGTWHIYLMDADGENVRQLTEGDSNNMFPVWRPIPADEVDTGSEEEEATEG